MRRDEHDAMPPELTYVGSLPGWSVEPCLVMTTPGNRGYWVKGPQGQGRGVRMFEARKSTLDFALSLGYRPVPQEGGGEG